MKRDKEINLPDYNSKADILYRDYYEFVEFIQKHPEESLSGEFCIAVILRIFYSIHSNTANTLSAFQVDTLMKKVDTAIKTDSEFQPIIEYKKVKYGFIPSFKDITYGELVDMEACIKENNKIALTSILYRPIVKQNKLDYIIEPYNSYDADRFSNITLDIIEGYEKLFMKSYNDLSNHILSFTA